MAVDIATLGIKITTDGVTQAKNGLKDVTEEGKKAEHQTGKLSKSFDDLGVYIKRALAVFGVYQTSRYILEATLATERMNSAMKASAGTALATAKELAFVREESQRLGLEFRSTAESYAKFSAASKGTSIEGEGVRKIFKGVSEAATAMRLTTEQSNGVFLALQQMMSKGTVQAEELRGQLAERLPGAFGMAAKAMGMTTQELGKQLELGNVLSSDLLPKLAEEMHKTYGAAAIEAATGGQAAINHFKNSVFESASALGGALMPAFTGILGVLTPLMDYLKMFIGGIEILAVKLATLPDKAAAAWRVIKSGEGLFSTAGMAMYAKEKAVSDAAAEEAIADIMKKYMPVSSAKTAAEMAEEQSKVAAALAKEAGGRIATGLKTGLTSVQKEHQEQIKSFLKDSWEGAATELAAEDFSKDAYKKMGMFTAGPAGFTKNPALSLGVDTQFKSLEQQVKPLDNSTEQARKYAQLMSSMSGKGLQADNGYDSQLTALKDQQDARIAMIADYAEKEKLTEEQKNAAKLASDQLYADQKRALDENTAKTAAASLGNSLSSLGQTLMAGNKEQFEAGKKMAIAGATIQMMLGAVNAFTAMSSIPLVGPALGGLAAAAVIAQGTQNIAMISSQQYEGRELGGPVTAGQPYIVGEKRAEVFVPNQSGRIIPSTGEKSTNVTVVNQISAGVIDTTRAEIGRYIPAIVAQSVQAVKSAMRQGEFQGA